MQKHLSPSEILSYLSGNGFTSKALLSDVAARKAARQLINSHCRSKWASGSFIPANGGPFALWTLHTASKMQSADIKIPA